MDSNMSYTWVGGNDYIITDQYTPGYDNTQEGYAAFRASTVLQSGALVINEICASSITTLKDEDGDYPDWIEIRNTTNQAIDLSNYALSDSTDKLVKWRFPQGCVIEPNGYFVVFASKKDRAAAEGSWPHASFKLRSNGETVILSDIQGRMIDMVTYDLLSADTSWGRDEEGDGNFKLFTSPTPGLPNTRAGMTAMDTRMCLANTSGLYITEVMTGNKSTHGPNVNYYYDYIEIYNMSGQAVNLKGYGLSDNIKKPRKWQFPDITIENNSYLVIYCDTTQTSKDGVYYFTNYNLKKSGETVCLSTPSGQILDKVVVPQLYDDTSYGRTLGQAGLFYYSSGERTGLYRLCRAADLQRGGRPVRAAADGRKRGHDQRSGGQHRPLYARQHRPERILPDLHRANRDRNQHGRPRAHLSRRRGGLADHLRNVFDFRVSHNAGRLPDDRPG